MRSTQRSPTAQTEGCVRAQPPRSGAGPAAAGRIGRCGRHGRRPTRRAVAARRPPSGESTGRGSVARLGSDGRRALLDEARRSGAEGPSDCLSTAPSGLSNAGPLPLRTGRPRIRQHSDQANIVTLKTLHLSLLDVASMTSREHREGAGTRARQSPATAGAGITEICSRLVDPVPLHFWGQTQACRGSSGPRRTEARQGAFDSLPSTIRPPHRHGAGDA